jgi:hypothetical protein
MRYFYLAMIAILLFTVNEKTKQVVQLKNILRTYNIGIPHELNK